MNMYKENLKNYKEKKTMKTNESRKDSEKRSIYKSQMYFHTLAINNPKNEIKKLSIYT